MKSFKYSELSKKSVDINDLYDFYQESKSLPFSDSIVIHSGSYPYNEIKIVRVNHDLNLSDWDYCYFGDINLEYGGKFFTVEFNQDNKAYKLDGFTDGYNHVMTIDEWYLDSPRIQALLLQSGSAYIPDDSDDLESVKSFIGGICGHDTLSRQICLTDGCISYYGIQQNGLYPVNVIIVSQDNCDLDSSKLCHLLESYIDKYDVVIIPNWDNETILTVLMQYGLNHF